MATSLSTRKTNRAAAGAAYVAAAAAYVDAWIELQAHDQSLANGNIGGGHQPGFGEQPRIAGHSEFLRDIPATIGDPASRAAARRDQLISS